MRARGRSTEGEKRRGKEGEGAWRTMRGTEGVQEGRREGRGREGRAGKWGDREEGWRN